MMSRGSDSRRGLFVHKVVVWQNIRWVNNVAIASKRTRKRDSEWLRWYGRMVMHLSCKEDNLSSILIASIVCEAEVVEALDCESSKLASSSLVAHPFLMSPWYKGCAAAF